MARLSCTPMHKTVATQSHNAPVKEEPAYPAGMLTEIQLLPQQAGMAAILATAVINSECPWIQAYAHPQRHTETHRDTQRHTDTHILVICVCHIMLANPALQFLEELICDSEAEFGKNEQKKNSTHTPDQF